MIDAVGGTMVSKETNDSLWNALLDSNRLTRYYSKLASRMTGRHSLRTLALGFFATSAAVSLLNIIPPVVQVGKFQVTAAQVETVTSAAVALLAVWMMVDNHVQKLAVVRLVSERCQQLETETRTLFLNRDRLDDLHARSNLEMLLREINGVTAWPQRVGVRIDDALSKACLLETFQVIEEEYAAT